MEDGSCTHRKSYSLKLLSASKPPRNTKESEELRSSAGVQGAGPLASAERADSPSAEGWREFQREEGNASQCMVPFLSLRITPRRPQLVTLEARGTHSRSPHPT